jgi:hypothetical protein
MILRREKIFSANWGSSMQVSRHSSPLRDSSSLSNKTGLLLTDILLTFRMKLLTIDFILYFLMMPLSFKLFSSFGSSLGSLVVVYVLLSPSEATRLKSDDPVKGNSYLVLLSSLVSMGPLCIYSILSV